MSPKGARKLPREFRAAPQPNGNGWRASVKLLGQMVRGPTRTDKQQATDDLAVAQRTGTQEEMQSFLESLLVACDLHGQSLTADAHWKSWQKVRREMVAQPLAGAVSQSSGGASGHLRTLHRELSGTSDGSDGGEATVSSHSLATEPPATLTVKRELQTMSEEKLRSLPFASVKARADSSKAVCDSAADSLVALTLTQFREKARQTVGITEKKKVSGKWVPKTREDFIAELQGLQTALVAQPLAGHQHPAQLHAKHQAQQTICPRLRHLHRELSAEGSDEEEEVGEHVSDSSEAVGSAKNKQQPGSASSAVNLAVEELKNMGKKVLRALASQTLGISRDKKTSQGKWVPKTNDELRAELLVASSPAASQSLTGGCSAACKKKLRQERQRLRQGTDTYKEKRRMRQRPQQRTSKFRLAQNTRRRREEYKVRKRIYERGPKAKFTRAQRKRARFWEPCLKNWAHMRKHMDLKGATPPAEFAPRFHSDGRISILQHGRQLSLPCPDEPPLPTTPIEAPKTEWAKHYWPTAVQKGVVLSYVPFWVDVSVPKKLLVEGLGESPFVWTSEQGKPSGFCPVVERPCFGQKKRKVAGRVQAIDVEVVPRTGEQRRVFAVRPVRGRADVEHFFRHHVPGGWTERRNCCAPSMYHVAEDGNTSSEECLKRLRAFFGDLAEVSEMSDRAELVPPLRLAATAKANLLRELDTGVLSSGQYDGGDEKVFFKLVFSTSWKLLRRTTVLKTMVLERPQSLTGLSATKVLLNRGSLYEPKPWEEERLNEFKLALSLRCRIQTVHSMRSQSAEDKGCVQHSGSRCIHKKRLKRYSWKCPMEHFTYDQLLDAAVSDKCALDHHFAHPSAQVRQFLCNNLCPLQCCTLMCPWNGSSISEQDEPLPAVACRCGLQSCGFCEAEKAHRVLHSDVCVQDPPPPGSILYTGSVEPVSDSSPSEYAPVLYVLTCKKWRIVHSAFGPSRLPFNPVRQRQWQQCMENHGYNPHDFVHERVVSEKVYVKTSWTWTEAEGRQWDADAMLDLDKEAESGLEWQWEEGAKLQQTGGPSRIELAVPGGRAEVVDDVREWVSQLVNKEQCRPGSASRSLCKPLSLRCVFCTYVHGQPIQDLMDDQGLSLGRVRCRACLGSRLDHTCEKGNHRPPEDVAIHLAQAVTVLCMLWHGVDYRLTASFVWRCASKWRELQEYLDLHEAAAPPPGSASVGGSSKLGGHIKLDLKFPFHGELLRCSCVLSLQVQHAVSTAFIARVHAVREDLDARVGQAFVQQRLQDAADFRGKVGRLKAGRHELNLTSCQRRELLSKYSYGSPIFALVAPTDPPRMTLAATCDCKCKVPWASRSKWERWQSTGAGAGKRSVTYELPIPTSLWQSGWDGASREHFWELPERFLCGSSAAGGTPCQEPGKEHQLMDHFMSLFMECCAWSGRHMPAPTRESNDMKSSGEDGPNMTNQPIAEPMPGVACKGDEHEMQQHIEEEPLAPASGSASAHSFNKEAARAESNAMPDELLAWTSEAEEGASSHSEETLGSETANEQEGGTQQSVGDGRAQWEEYESESSTSSEEPWDVDDPEAYTC